MRLPLLILIAFWCCAGVVAEEARHSDKIRQSGALQRRLQTLSEKQAAKRSQLRVMKRAQRRLADQLNDSYQRLESAKGALNASQDRLRQAEEAFQQSTRSLLSAEERLTLQQRRFGRRVAAAYMAGPTTYAEVLLGARSLTDLLDRHYYVSRLTQADARLLDGLRSARTAVAREREQVLRRKGEVELAHKDNRLRVDMVSEQTSARYRLLERVRRERALQEQRLAELEQDSREIEQALRQELLRRRANPGAYRNLPRWSGRLGMPAQGRIVSGFGYRYHPILGYRRLHTGLDIGAPAGAAVFAAAAGEVFHASWRGGYGQCIILLHGGGMSTLYGHLSRIHVRPGQWVRRGEVIGAVGSTGLATGPHLHFELRRDGVPVNPY